MEQLTTWEKQNIQQAFDQTLAEFELKLGKLAQPLRVALTGAGASPSIDDTIFHIGQQRAVQRIHNAIDFIESAVPKY